MFFTGLSQLKQFKPYFIVLLLQLSSVESLCKPPYARNSNMAKKSLDLLLTGENTDMVFEIVMVQGRYTERTILGLFLHFRKYFSGSVLGKKFT